jgi:DNA-binding PadR family transcriptional regulator
VLTNAELAILSLLAEAARHGYDIESQIEARHMRDWTDIGFSSIYYILNKLEKGGLVIAQREPSPGGGPDRKVYQLTTKGRAVWQAAALDVLAAAGHAPSPTMLGIASVPQLDRAAVLSALASRREGLTARRDRIRERMGEASNQTAQAMFELSLALIGAELGWLELYVAQLSTLEAR